MKRRVSMLVAAILAIAAAPMTSAAQDEVGFTLKVVLSPTAAARLTAAKHKMQVVALYAGEPLPKWEGSADQESGDIEMGADIVEISGSGSVHLTGKALQRERLAWIKPGTFHVTVSVNPKEPYAGADSISCDAPDSEGWDYGIYEIGKINGHTLVFNCK